MTTKAKASKNGAVNRVAELDAPATMKPELLTFDIRGMSPLLQNNPASFIGAEEETALAVKKLNSRSFTKSHRMPATQSKKRSPNDR